jgi:hypothetical protein
MILLNHDTSLIKGMYAGRFQSNGKAISGDSVGVWTKSLKRAPLVH